MCLVEFPSARPSARRKIILATSKNDLASLLYTPNENPFSGFCCLLIVSSRVKIPPKRHARPTSLSLSFRGVKLWHPFYIISQHLHHIILLYCTARNFLPHLSRSIWDFAWPIALWLFSPTRQTNFCVWFLIKFLLLCIIITKFTGFDFLLCKESRNETESR